MYASTGITSESGCTTAAENIQDHQYLCLNDVLQVYLDYAAAEAAMGV